MKLILIRHGDAEDQEAFARTGAPDEARPLTADGKEKMAEIARGLKRVVDNIDLIGASPLTRAQQTADPVAREFPNAARETVEAMAPDQPFQEFRDWLLQRKKLGCVAAVGHNPHISALASWLTVEDSRAFLDMKKGSALLLEFEDEIEEGNALLRWYLTPKHLRMLMAGD
ncbi:MAG: phosphohistidine phosphatase SixA [Gemmatimonadota bacterium]